MPEPKPEPEPISIEVVAADPQRRALCAAAIDKYGFRIVGAATVDAALQEIEVRPSDYPRPALFVLAGMGMDGIQAALRELRGHPWTAKCRVLVVDESLSPEQALALIDSGVNECYTKPFLAPVYAARVRGALRGGTA